MDQTFERAVDAVITGDAATLRELLRDTPELVRARSARPHHCTLLHYIGANGVEEERQQTPPNAIEIAKMLLDAGAEPDALADLYDSQCTTMGLLVSSTHPAKAGLQAPLAELLLDYGASLEGALRTALRFGYRETAEALIRRGATVDFAAAAALGRHDEVVRMLPEADAANRHIALALAALHGQTDVVRLLLDAGEDPSRYNPEGYHAHSTPLHQAVWSDHADVVRLLVERGARLDLRDTIHQGTPLDWAVYGNRTAIADYLRAS
jgi:ankyrin repeat protein